MKVTEDEFTAGLIADGVLADPAAYGAACKIHDGRGTRYERQEYTSDEVRWACGILGKPVDHTTNPVRCNCIQCRRKNTNNVH